MYVVPKTYKNTNKYTKKYQMETFMLFCFLVTHECTCNKEINFLT